MSPYRSSPLAAPAPRTSPAKKPLPHWLGSALGIGLCIVTVFWCGVLFHLTGLDIFAIVMALGIHGTVAGLVGVFS